MLQTVSTQNNLKANVKSGDWLKYLRRDGRRGRRRLFYVALDLIKLVQLVSIVALVGLQTMCQQLICFLSLL